MNDAGAVWRRGRPCASATFCASPKSPIWHSGFRQAPQTPRNRLNFAASRISLAEIWSFQSGNQASILVGDAPWRLSVQNIAASDYLRGNGLGPKVQMPDNILKPRIGVKRDKNWVDIEV